MNALSAAIIAGSGKGLTLAMAPAWDVVGLVVWGLS